jgi:hypothetical protein
MPQRPQTYLAKVRVAKPKRNDYSKKTSNARGYTYKWRKLRLAKIAESPVCEICERAFTVDVHHVNKVSDGHPVLCELSDLRGLCHSCHSDLTAQGL